MINFQLINSLEPFVGGSYLCCEELVSSFSNAFDTEGFRNLIPENLRPVLDKLAKSSGYKDRDLAYLFVSCLYFDPIEEAVSIIPRLLPVNRSDFGCYSFYNEQKTLFYARCRLGRAHNPLLLEGWITSNPTAGIMAKTHGKGLNDEPYDNDAFGSGSSFCRRILEGD